MSSDARAGAVALALEGAPDRAALGAFAAAAVIGGSNFVAIRFSNRELDPLWGAGLRFAAAAVGFGVLCLALRLSLPRGRGLLFAGLYGLLTVAGTYGFLYLALREVPAGIAAVVLAVGPLLTLLLAAAHGTERVSTRAVAGALVAILGSAVIFFQPASIAFGAGSFVLLVLAALCASEAVVVSKLAGRIHPVAMNVVGMSVGAAALLLLCLAGGATIALPQDRETRLALVYLVAATIGLFLLVLFVVQRWAASVVSYLFVLMPVVAVAMGAILADEPVTPTTILGGTIVCGGVYVGAARRS